MWIIKSQPDKDLSNSKAKVLPASKTQPSSVNANEGTLPNCELDNIEELPNSEWVGEFQVTARQPIKQWWWPTQQSTFLKEKFTFCFKEAYEILEVFFYITMKLISKWNALKF